MKTWLGHFGLYERKQLSDLIHLIYVYISAKVYGFVWLAIWIEERSDRTDHKRMYTASGCAQ